MGPRGGRLLKGAAAAAAAMVSLAGAGVAGGTAVPSARWPSVVGAGAAGGTAVPSARWPSVVGASVSVGMAASATSRPAHRPWMNRSLPPLERAKLLVAAMTTAEKLAMVHGVVEGVLEIPPVDYAGYIAPIPALGIPALNFEDGPGGVGDAMENVTDFPAPLALAATFDTELARNFGSALGAEQKAKGTDVVLAPTVNIVRDPRWGRSFETFGEDPFLSGALGDQVIEGIQSNGVIAEVKHLAAYAEETDRTSGDVQVSQRALHEIYLPPFEAAVTQAHAGAVMAAYNEVNGEYSSQNADLLTKTLVDTWHFAGFTTSDWDGTHSTVAAAGAGLDVEMPDARYFGQPLAAALARGQVSGATLDRMVRSILTSMFAAGLFDRAQTGRPFASVATPAHRALAEKIEEEAIVLLKNRGGLLPVSAKSDRSIAVVDVPVDIGSNPVEPSEKVNGCGSAYVNPNDTVSVTEGISRLAGRGVRVTSVEPENPVAAAHAASRADIALVVVHDDGCEDVVQKTLQGSPVADRPDLDLPGNEDQLIEAVAAANPDTVVVLETQGAVTMPWISRVPAVVEAWYGGEEMGAALGAVLFGDVDPSGKLPETFPESESQMPTSAASSFPGVDGVTDFSEGIDVGYRYYDAHHLTPLFPFGYGLSYTAFTVSNLSVGGSIRAGRMADGTSPGALGTVQISATVTDSGSRRGTDVVEVYVGDPRSTGEPPRQLAGIARVSLAKRQSSQITVDVPSRALAWWDSPSSSWEVSPGDYTFMIGSSSSSIVAQRSLTVG